MAKPLALLQSFFVAASFVLLVQAFLSHDFSLAYVAQNSHPDLPFFYCLTAVWGAHEGSFLLWIFLLDLWTVAFCFFGKEELADLKSLTLALLGLLSFCFLAFLLQTSSPFIEAAHALPQDLNPLLQDPGFFIHPPMLYAGYVGFSIVFALTLATLLGPEHNSQVWARLTRPWVMAAWSCLTLGITLGSWWAYHVLGWGGFWFWDPVENASLLPWLSGIALIHVLLIVERQGRFFDWAITLAILCFTLSILGTFLVRSGVLISVHSFATDPSRGLYLLILLALIMGSALAIQGLRSKSPSKDSQALFQFTSREGFLLLQSLLLFVSMATVLLATLYPMIMEALNLGTLSVGPPYFNRVLYPLVVLVLLFMGLASQSLWGKALNKTQLKYYFINALISLLLAAFLTLFFTHHFHCFIILNLGLIFWVLLSIRKTLLRHTLMTAAHSGFVIMIMSILLAANFSQTRELRLSVGEEMSMGPYVLHFTAVKGEDGPNYRGVRGEFQVLTHGRKLTLLSPEKRIYQVRDMVMTKVDIYPGVFHDLYLALGEPVSQNVWSVRVYYKPFIRWVWLGGFLMGFSGLLSLLAYLGRKDEKVS